MTSSVNMLEYFNTLNVASNLIGMELCNPQCHVSLLWLNKRNSL